MRYLLGQSIGSHERLTCLIVPCSAPPSLLVPLLERPGWNGSPAESTGIAIVTWDDGDDPYAAVADLLPAGAAALGVDPMMPAAHALGVRDAAAGSQISVATGVLAQLRMRKSAAEVAALRSIGAAVDRVHRRMGEWLRVGRTENEVAADIAAALVAEGHVHADFVIVGSGPNGASPHHEASDRVIAAGDPVVVDIGGPGPDGYFSDCTRTYLMGGAASDPEFPIIYDAVRAAQAAGIAAARADTPCEDVDAAARAVITAAGYGDRFITRTGHGIGLEVHEHPYIVIGNRLPLAPGMTFSVEPGIYLPGRFGVRIEDIVVITDSGVERCNTTPTDLVVLEG